MGIYTTGELQLVYDLVREFPNQMFIEVQPLPKGAQPGQNVKLTLKVSSPELAQFVDYLVRRLQLARSYVVQTSLVDPQTLQQLLPTHPEFEGECSEGG